MTAKRLAAVLAVTLAGCSSMDGGVDSPSASAGSAVAELRTAAGVPAGRAVATEADGGVRVTVEVVATPPGVHGAHVHAVGRCDGPDFTTAAGHWNPTGRQHGMQNPQGPHGGDMPNLTVGADGRGSLSMALPSGTLAGLLDADGAAFVIHAGPDDMITDPAGNSGARIACGVFAAA